MQKIKVIVMPIRSRVAAAEGLTASIDSNATNNNLAAPVYVEDVLISVRMVSLLVRPVCDFGCAATNTEVDLLPFDSTLN